MGIFRLLLLITKQTKKQTTQKKREFHSNTHRVSESLSFKFIHLASIPRAIQMYSSIEAKKAKKKRNDSNPMGLCCCIFFSSNGCFIIVCLLMGKAIVGGHMAHCVCAFCFFSFTNRILCVC